MAVETYGLPIAPPPVIAAVLAEAAPAHQLTLVAALTKRNPLGYVASAEELERIINVSATTIKKFRRNLDAAGGV